MAPSDIFTLLLVSVIVTAATTFALAVTGFGLGLAGAGTGRWVTGDLVLCMSRSIMLAGTAPSFISAWEQAIGSWRPHSLSVALYLAAMWFHASALRQAHGRAMPTLKRTWLSCAALVAAWMCVAYAIDNIELRLRMALLAIALLSATTLHAAWPLGRKSWGGRMIALALILATSINLPQGLLGSFYPSAPKSLYTVFLIELVVSIFLATGFLVMLQERLRDRITEVSITDSLTGAYNRRGVLPVMQRAMANASRSGQPLSVVIFDLDHFKQVNDQFGHATGDAVLRSFSQRIKAMTREGDAWARWGGEEFVLLLPDMDLKRATLVAERMRVAVAISRLAEDVPCVTVSAGVAQAASFDWPSIDGLLQQADQRLYMAKRTRNCVVGASGAENLAGVVAAEPVT